MSQIKRIRAGVLVAVFLGLGLSAGAQTQPASAPTSRPAMARASVKQAVELIKGINKELSEAMAACRRAMLGRRDPNGETCCPLRAAGYYTDVLKRTPPGSLAGGPGSWLLAAVRDRRRRGGPMNDYRWQQEVMRPALRAWKKRAETAREKLKPLMKQVMLLKSDMPAGLPFKPLPWRSNWPEQCMENIQGALNARDPEAAKNWAGELAGTLAALDDLLRWEIFLVDNNLENLAYQVQCRDLLEAYVKANPNARYNPGSSSSRFPGFCLLTASIHNFLEVERQAERILQKPDAFEKLAAKNPNAPKTLTPEVREAFLTIREKLSPAARKVWDAAATAPYERSFLQNHLYRVQFARKIPELATVLQRYDKRHPKPTLDEMMDVMVYRAGLGMAGLEPADRFLPKLMELGGTIRGTDRPAMHEAAREEQWKIYGGGDNYKNMVLTLRQSLEKGGKMDCIRGTDMIAAIYRNAGMPGFVNIRWTRGVQIGGHTTGGVRYNTAVGEKVAVGDSLFPAGRRTGHFPWAIAQVDSSLYSIELSGRGLDNYVMLEAYIADGKNKGKLIKFSVPYIPGRENVSTLKKSVPQTQPATQPAE